MIEGIGVPVLGVLAAATKEKVGPLGISRRRRMLTRNWRHGNA
jgi:hypothetical protein